MNHHRIQIRSVLGVHVAFSLHFLLVFGLQDLIAAPLPRPLELTANSITPTGVMLKWNVSTTPFGDVTYEIFRDQERFALSMSNAWNCTGLVPNQPLTFRVRARGSDGSTSQLSNALLVTPRENAQGVRPLVVRTNYKALVLNYDPEILVAGSLVQAASQYGYRDVNQLVAEYIDLFRRASGGQVAWSFEQLNLNEFPPPEDPSHPRFNAANYVMLRSQGYDYGNNPIPGPAYRSILADPRFGIGDRVRNAELDGIWVFAPSGCAFAETAMIGPNPYWINGAPIYEQSLDRNVVFYGFGKESHQGVGFMCENTAHMAENIMSRIASNWPRNISTRVFNTLNLDNPNRHLVIKSIHDWTHFTQSEAASWDPVLVAAGASQAGLSHFPPTAMFNYNWSTVDLGFDPSIWHAYDGSWSVADGEYRAAEGKGTKVLAFDGMTLRDDLGAYRPPIAFSDADVELTIHLLTDLPGSNAGFLFRVNQCHPGFNQVKGYYLGLDAANDQIFLARLDGAMTPLGQAPLVVDTNTPYRIRLEARGNRFTLYLNDAVSPLLSTTDDSYITGAFGFTTYFAEASFGPVHIIAHTQNYGDQWYRYPERADQPRYISALEWNGDRPGNMDRFYAWWWEHLPKNGGAHAAVDLATSQSSLLLNNWWPYIFDINRFSSTLPALDIQFPPEDFTLPNSPVSFRVAPLDPGQVGLSWEEPSDNIGVTRYAVFRNGSFLQTTTLPYLTDSRLDPSTAYTYFVRALDGSGNWSAPSAPVTVITPPLDPGSAIFSSDFEIRPEAAAWISDSFRPGAVDFQWEPPPLGRNGSRCISITNSQENDSRWTRTLSGLIPGATYWLSGWIKGSNIVREPNRDIGANLCLIGTWEHSPDFLDGTFDWRQVSFPFTAPPSGVVTVGCRLGYWSNTATGKAFFDDLIVISSADFRLTRPMVLPNGALELQLLSQPGQACQIESSSDLKSWTLLREITPVHPVTSFTDDLSQTRRFYRAARR